MREKTDPKTFARRIVASTPPVREAQVEAYLLKRVKELGGEVRKVAWIGRRGAPDRFVMMPQVNRPNFWVELKAPGRKPEPHQDREIERMRHFDEIIYVLDSFEAIDRVLASYTGRR